MSLLSPLQDLIDNLRGRNQSEDRTPLDLSRSDIKALKRLISSPEWKTYLSVLDKFSTLNVEGIMSARQDRTWDRGFVSGVRKAGLIPEEIVHRTEKAQSERIQRATDRADRALRRRKLATFGSRFWESGADGSDGQ